jgi:hypothetical protein
MADMVGSDEFAYWLVAVSWIECELGPTSGIVVASLALLPLAPESAALVALADPLDRQVYRDDVLSGINSCLDDLGLTRLDELEYGWIALWDTFRPAHSLNEELTNNRLRFDLQLRYPALSEYTTRFIAAQDDLDEGGDPVEIARFITAEVEKVRPQFLLGFRVHFESSRVPWVLRALGV